MSLLPILTWPDPRLSKVCAPVEDLAAVETLVGDMFETMYAAPGRGLAAPQVGVMQRLFVMDAGWKEGEMTPLVCINPKIAQRSEHSATGDEGCLSMPRVLACVTRPAEIVLEYTDLTGASCSAALSGFEAICAQHELDHLDGLMHIDRLEEAARADILTIYGGLS